MSKILVDRIELRNFFSYGNSWTAVDFKEGINVVLGHDVQKDRSNGSGKTSFLESIPFALFGQTSKDVNLNKIVNWRNGKNCEVRLTFTKDGIQYVLHRGIKPGILELYKDGQAVPKLSDKRMFQQELESDLLGMDFRIAQMLMFQNANNMISMFNTPRADKRKFIEKLFNLELYSKMNEHVNNKLRALTDKLTEVGMEVSFKQKRIDELETDIKNGYACPDISAYEATMNAAQNAYNNAMVIVAEFAVDLVREDMDNISEAINELNDFVEKTKDYVEKLKDEQTTIRVETRTLLDTIAKIGDIEEQKEKREKIKKALKKFEGIDERIVSKKVEIREQEGFITQVKVAKGELSAQKKVLLADLKSWEGKKVLDTAECPSCFQKVNKHHIEWHIEEKIGELNGRIGSVDDLIAKADDELTGYDERLSELKGELTALETDKENKTKFEKALATLTGLDEKEEQLADARARVAAHDERTPILKRLLETHEEIIKEKGQEISDLQKSLKNHAETVHQYELACKDKEAKYEALESAVATLYEMRQVADRLEAEYQAKVASVAQLKSEISDSVKENEKLNKMKDYLDYIKTTLKDENVKQYAISSIVPYLQQQTNHYLSETGHNYYIELNSWLEGEIKGFGVGECDFGNMSGGEGKSIDLALKFAMMDVARRQAGSYLDILVLDELLDSSIDSYGLEKTMDIVKMKQREDNLKVYVVSHREEIGDFGVDRIYRVRKENGFSTIGEV